MLQVPFYINHGHRCGQVALKCVLEAKSPERIFSLRELEELTLHETGQITYPVQLSYALQKLNVPHKYFVRPSGIAHMSDSNEFVRVTRENAGDYAQDNLNKSQIKGISEITPNLSAVNIEIRDQRPPISELKQYLDLQKIPICLINFDKFVGRENHFAGHYIIVTDIGEDYLLYHNSGPKSAGPNQKVSLNRFQKAWNLCLFDWDLIVV